MSPEYGIWSDAAGGFIDGPYYTAESAVEAVAYLLTQGEDILDLQVLPWVED